MNRSIKFRFWCENIKKMGSWEDALKKCNRLSLLNMPGWIPLQFTGLLDKNGKEIYEGDILKWREGESGKFWNKIVIFDAENACFTLKPYYPLSVNIKFQGEVIDNIYENPELLEANR